jgi:lysozyme
VNLALLADQLTRHEGIRLHAYQDSVGYWTIGIGRMIDKRLGGGITTAEARYLLDNDIEKVLVGLDEALPWWQALDDVRQRVLADMTFNLGQAGLLKFKRTLALIEGGEYESAARAMLQSKWAAQVKGRAVRLAEMMRTGEDAA